MDQGRRYVDQPRSNSLAQATSGSELRGRSAGIHYCEACCRRVSRVWAENSEAVAGPDVDSRDRISVARICRAHLSVAVHRRTNDYGCRFRIGSRLKAIRRAPPQMRSDIFNAEARDDGVYQRARFLGAY